MYITNISATMLIFAIVSSQSSAFAAGIPDSDITDCVKDALYRDVRVDSYDINVSTTNGVVMLSGSVNSLAARKRNSTLLGLAINIAVSYY